jgi:RNA polymerase sigma-70 factor (ECF subfamily)
MAVNPARGFVPTPRVALPANAAPDPDIVLIGAVVAGSPDALAELYDRHADALFSAALRLLVDAGAAGEVVQDTFLAAWDRAESFDASRGSLRAWLMTIARNRAIDEIRRRTRRGRSLPFSAFDLEQDDETTAEWLTTTAQPLGMGRPDTTPDQIVSTQESAAAVRAAIADLAPVEQQVIELAYGAELTQAEIAARLGWPIGTVKTRTRRALRRLRAALEGADRDVAAGFRGSGTGTPSAA